MATSSRFQVYVLAFCATLLIQSGCYGHSVHQRKHTALFIFGDSTFDVGNNNYINTSTYFQANFFPYGETFFSHPTGRFSDGRLIPDIIAEYANLPMIPPYLQPGFDNYTNGVNFASSGAGVLAETHQGFVLDLKTQLGYFKNVEKQLRHRLGEAEAHTLLSEAVYLIAIGSGDYSFPFIANSSLFESHTHEEYVGMVIGNLTNVIKEIYEKGGRRFGIKGIGNLGCIPGLRIVKPGNTSTCNEEVNALSKLHNRVLAKALLELKGQLQDFIYSNPNLYPYADDVVHNPSKYGFKEAEMACCGSGPLRRISSCGGKRGVTEYQLCDNVTDYVYFDSGHPTERYNQKLSKLWWSHTPDVTGRYINLKELFEV
ncbi:putative SGNH hydrolase-type esterase domain-containing protein [Rosa chinensis]|uniref:Putative SGNH hydrolase-type esterase domain-containing protein n=1 Tax=Rosa chinensis TaxID=74649 RepID=A0A2P6RZ44_ROSCH|nr:GDSL esterase/lipase 1 [Rosa chinensis]PRQ51701.1 putative SGNH hydrolase-type esterase domain-containing protein [Rosa chinensis]